MTKLKKNIAEFQFDVALKQLEGLVERLEHGNLPLEKALAEFETGVGLVRQCQSALQAAEQKVQILLGSDPNGTLQPFNQNTLADDED